MSKKHKLLESSSYDISIGRGKEPTSGKSYQRLTLDNNALLNNKMFSAGLISSEVQQSPSFNGIINEFKSGMSFIIEQSELEDHCIKFLRACIEIRGAIAKAARALQKDWKEGVWN